MKCRDCRQGRRFSAGAVNCVLYGMIIREDHECTREGWKLEDEGNGDDDQRGESDDENKIRYLSRRGAGEVPGVV